MKKELKQTSMKYIVLPIAMLGLVAVLALSATDKVNAFGGSMRSMNRGGANHTSEFAAVMAQKFGLDQSAVEETIQGFHQQEMELRHQEMESRMGERLQRAVTQGNLTETQMHAILEKHDEMYERMQELHDQDLSPEDMREMRADVHEEMQTWADEQGIDFEVFMTVGKQGGQRKHLRD